MALYAIIRLRGIPDTPYDVQYTLRLLRLVRRFHCILYPDTPDIRGMLLKVKDWVTWGEIEKEVLVELLRRRGRVVGNRPLTEEFIKKRLGFQGFDDFADALLSHKVLYHKLEEKGVKPVFRLHPPKGGFKGSIKKPFGAGGELGYRGPAINELLLRMI
ncbi:MAG: 50S ribosomal protein L30 [Thermoprotei archaeon]|nr:MAG: 50S ribosomal protein L30 [Thermoprotei archaeon]